jgi:branched-chain amino acid transport system substrate-binding protein
MAWPSRSSGEMSEEEFTHFLHTVLGYSMWEPRPALGLPGVKEFIEHYEKRFGEKPNHRAAIGYTEMQIYEAAVKKAGSINPEKVRDAMASITVNTIFGPWNVDERGFMSIDGLAIQIQNGKRVIVWPATIAEAKVVAMPKWEDRAQK